MGDPVGNKSVKPLGFVAYIGKYNFTIRPKFWVHSVQLKIFFESAGQAWQPLQQQLILILE